MSTDIETPTLSDIERHAVEIHLESLKPKAVRDAVEAAILYLELDADSAADEAEQAQLESRVRHLAAAVEAALEDGDLAPRAPQTKPTERVALLDLPDEE